MDIDNFYGIGIVDVYWTYDELKPSSWRKAFISLYIPNNHGYKRGEQFAIKYSFLDDKNVIDEEIFESPNYNLDIIEKNNNYLLINLFGEKYRITNEQYKKLMELNNN